MEVGPTTIRADVEVADIVRRLTERGVSDVLVTTPEGRLIGLVRRTSGA